MLKICAIDNKPLQWNNNKTGQTGWFCCDEYYCSQDCLEKSFDNTDVMEEGGWDNHFTQEGECYFTEWELE